MAPASLALARIVPFPKAVRVPSWNRAVNDFLEHIRVIRGYSPHTIRAYRKDLQDFFEDQRVPIDQVDYKTCRTWVHRLRFCGVQPKTVNRKIHALRSFYKFACREEMATANPARLLDLIKTETRLPVFLTVNDTQKLFDGLGRLSKAPLTRTGHKGNARAIRRRGSVAFRRRRDIAILELLYASGLRASELVGLNLEDVNQEDLLLLVRGKGKKERMVPFGSKAGTAIGKYMPLRGRYMRRLGIESGALFVTKKSARISAREVQRIVKKYCREVLDNDTMHPHSFRHSFATHLMDSGVGLRELQEMLGHSSVSTTTIYEHTSMQRLLDVHARCHPRGEIVGGNEK